MSSIPQRRRIVKPAQCESKVIREVIAPCEILPYGLPGIIVINGTMYTSQVLGYLPEVGEPVINGYRLIKEDGTVHDICMSYGALECSCGDFIWRRQARDPKGCKHCQAVRKHFVQPRDQAAVAIETVADFEVI